MEHYRWIFRNCSLTNLFSSLHFSIVFRLKLQNQTKTADVVAKEKDVRIYSLMKENEKLFNESRILKAELSSKTEEMIQSKRAKKDYLFEVQWK